MKLCKERKRVDEVIENWRGWKVIVFFFVRGRQVLVVRSDDQFLCWNERLLHQCSEASDAQGNCTPSLSFDTHPLFFIPLSFLFFIYFFLCEAFLTLDSPPFLSISCASSTWFSPYSGHSHSLYIYVCMYVYVCMCVSHIYICVCFRPWDP